MSCPKQPSVARLEPFLTQLSLSYRNQGVNLTKGLGIAAVSMPLQALRGNFQTLERTNMNIPRACMGPSARASSIGGFRSPQAGNVWVPYLCGMGSHGHLLPLPLTKKWEWDHLRFAWDGNGTESRNVLQ